MTSANLFVKPHTVNSGEKAEVVADASTRMPRGVRPDRVDYSKTTNAKLVEALFADDEDAWVFVWAGVLKKVKMSCKYSEMLNRASLQPEDVACQVYNDLQAADFAKLRGYRSEGPFSNWLCKVVQTTVRTLVNRAVGSGREVSTDFEDPEGVAANVQADEVSQEAKDRLLDSRLFLTKLWRGNPDGFWALLLKHEAGLSSKTISVALKTTEANVNTLTNRARKQMAELEKKQC